MLYDLYKDGVITLEEYHALLMERTDAAIKAAEKEIQRLREEG